MTTSVPALSPRLSIESSVPASAMTTDASATRVELAAQPILAAAPGAPTKAERRAALAAEKEEKAKKRHEAQRQALMDNAPTRTVRQAAAHGRARDDHQLPHEVVRRIEILKKHETLLTDDQQALLDQMTGKRDPHCRHQRQC